MVSFDLITLVGMFSKSSNISQTELFSIFCCFLELGSIHPDSNDLNLAKQLLILVWGRALSSQVSLLLQESNFFVTKFQFIREVETKLTIYSLEKNVQSLFYELMSKKFRSC
jgi:hypothetical protein